MHRTWVLTTCLSLTAALTTSLPAAAADRFNLPDGPGRELVYGNCQTCHDLQSVQDSAGIRPGAWNALLDNMREFGLRITPDQRERILSYLSTYLGPNPPTTADVGKKMLADGASIFADTCQACHQEGGVGKGNEFPPLAANGDLFMSTDFPGYVVLNGIEGKITVEGKVFENAMPPFDFLTDEEIASVIAYVRSSFGNADLRPGGFADLTADDIAKLRANPVDASDVLKLRAKLKGK